MKSAKVSEHNAEEAFIERGVKYGKGQQFVDIRKIKSKQSKNRIETEEEEKRKETRSIKKRQRSKARCETSVSI